MRPDDRRALSTEGLPAHHILAAELADAPPLAGVIGEIDARLREGFLLLHFASLDLAFLRDGLPPMRAAVAAARA